MECGGAAAGADADESESDGREPGGDDPDGDGDGHELYRQHGGAGERERAADDGAVRHATDAHLIGE